MVSRMSPQELIFGFLASRLDLSELPWLETSASLLRREPDDKTVFTLFSAALRHSGKKPLSPTARELADADALVPGWNPADWTLDQTVRIYLLLALPPTPESANRMDLIHQTADLGEALALLKALPLLPNPLDQMARAREGARSNVKSQFEAVALRNPFPAAHFDEAAWNQLVSKAIFVDSPLEEIYGLDQRANRRLNRILLDLIAERQAAGRAFTPLLYRCLGPCAGEEELDAIEAALPTAPQSARESILKGLALCPLPRAARILDRFRFERGIASEGTFRMEESGRGR
jgi:hypothetical protein